MFFALDSYGLLAYFQDEPARARMETLLDRARRGEDNLYLCTVNYAEVLYWMQRRHGDRAVRRVVGELQDQLPVMLVAADVPLSRAAAQLKASHPVSLADCYVVALAQQERAMVLTGDRDFVRFEDLGMIQVEWLPSHR